MAWVLFVVLISWCGPQLKSWLNISMWRVSNERLSLWENRSVHKCYSALKNLLGLFVLTIKISHCLKYFPGFSAHVALNHWQPYLGVDQTDLTDSALIPSTNTVLTSEVGAVGKTLIKSELNKSSSAVCCFFICLWELWSDLLVRIDLTEERRCSSQLVFLGGNAPMVSWWLKTQLSTQPLLSLVSPCRTNVVSSFTKLSLFTAESQICTRQQWEDRLFKHAGGASRFRKQRLKTPKMRHKLQSAASGLFEPHSAQTVAVAQYNLIRRQIRSSINET